MTTVIIKSDSEKKTLLLMQLAEELGLMAEAQNAEELDTMAMVTGIGRKATDEELINYLSKDAGKPVDLDIAFAKYSNSK